MCIYGCIKLLKADFYGSFFCIFLPIILTSFQAELELLDSNVYCEYDENTG